jgi:sigma-B regulation protein RsbU (phosphoserine phosphatase)
VDLSAVNVPSQVVSGDYYDFIQIVDNHWGMVVADVAGNGISAGLIMSAFSAALLAEIRNNYSISSIMTKVNNLLWETSAENRFVTAFYGVFDEQQRVLTYCNAGHNFPILMRKDGSIEELETGGRLLGAFNDRRYQEGRVSLSAGDWMLVYTDGLTDSVGPDGEDLGREGLIQFLKTLPGDSASTRFGICIVKTPPSYAAETAPVSTSTGSVKLLLNLPIGRSPRR